ncbi:MAG: RNA polymerase sigma factor [Fulvivirga sp.]|uniref:RNA polymerase sigma factor n=1 Tax=Fulvivirga sp. TaxID=1931237 RepID=UPI0032ED5D54
MINKNLSDEQIIYVLQKEGNNRYFTILSERYENSIIKKCKSYVKDEDTAEDLCQEILLKVFLKLNSFQGNAKFSTWLFSIIHNTCIDYLRKHKKNVSKIITDKMVDEVADLIEGVDELPDELSEQILFELMDNISAEDRLLLLLKYKEKHSIKDIQLSLQLSESAIKMRLKRAKDRINKLYLEQQKG